MHLADTYDKKQCPDCGKVLGIEHFYRNRNSYLPRCKACHKKVVSRQQKNNTTRAKRTNAQAIRRSKRAEADGWFYQEHIGWIRETLNGIQLRRNKRTLPYPLDEIIAISIRAKGCCEICGKKGTFARSLYLDHNHETGELRGVLCPGCNTGISAFGYDLVQAQKALNYLRDTDKKLQDLV